MAREVAAPQPPTAKAIAPRIAGALKHEVNVRIGVEPGAHQLDCL
jgi:hypothetical protein